MKKALGTFAILVFAASLASAQATRTWVSGVGDDANPCSRTAPCKTFAGAISKTAAGGEINVLDPGGFGGVTITKSISIISDSFTAGVLVSGTNAIIINAGANDLIELAGLDIEGLGTGLSGIKFLAGGSLHVRNSIIRNFRSGSDGHGINFAPSGTSKLFLDNVDVKNNGTGTTGGGILIKPTGVGSATAVIQNSRLNGNVFGIKAEAIGAGAVKVEMHDSSTAQNAFSGMTANGAAGVTEIFAERVVSALNGTTGVQSNGANATIRLSFCDVYANGTGLQNSASGKILSFSNNRIRGNGTDGAPTGTETVQ
jgi:hypothetical protein